VKCLFSVLQIPASTDMAGVIGQFLIARNYNTTDKVILNKIIYK